MRHPLEVKLRRYRARARLYSTLTVSGYLLVVYAIVLLSLGAIDWYWRPTSSTIRVSLWLLTLSPLLSIPISLYRAFRRRRTSVELATDLERTLPPLRNWLAGAIDFLHVKKETPTAGSKELRDAVIRHATELSEGLNFSKTLNRRPVYRSLGTLTIVLGVTAIIVALHPNAALTASRRLAQPLDPIAWPRKTSLVVKKSPTRLARGDSFQAVVTDQQNRNLPEEATVFYRFDQSPNNKNVQPTIEAETVRTDGHQIVLFRDRVNRPFSFRVISGDDNRMPWQSVAVVEPPAIKSLKMQVTLPIYLGYNATVTLPVKDQTSVHEGSVILLIAEVTKPVCKATLLLGESQYDGICSKRTQRICFLIDPLDASTTTDRSCPIVFYLEDEHGLKVTVDQSQRIEIIENLPPTVTLLRPEGDERAVANAVVPVEVVAEDDLSIHSLAILGTIEGTSGTRSFVKELHRGPDKPTTPPPNLGACPPTKQKLTFNYRLDLTPMKLAVGDRLSLQMDASDYSGLVTKTEPIEIKVVDPATFINQLASSQRAITDEMAQTLTISKQNHRRMNQVRKQLEQSGEIRTTSLDLLRAVMLDRRQTVRTLTDENDGLITRSSLILTQLDDSRLHADSLRNQLVRRITNLKTLRSEVLPEVEQNITRATKNAELALDPQSGIEVPTSEILSPLSTAILAQERLIEKLTEMLGRLDEMVDYQRFCDDLKRLTRSQETLIEKTKTLGRTLLGRVKTDLEQAELTQLNQVSQDQVRLARESDQTVARMIQAADRLSDEDNRIALAVKPPQTQSVGATLTRASEAISQNQLGRAVKLQTESLAELKSMLAQMTQTVSPLPENTSSVQPIQIEDQQPGDTAKQGEKPDSSPLQDTTNQTGNQTDKATSFPQHQPRQIETQLKPKTIDNLIERFWGELPDREREPILQLPGERFLPGYERQIESYYRRLLEQ